MARGGPDSSSGLQTVRIKKQDKVDLTVLWVNKSFIYLKTHLNFCGGASYQLSGIGWFVSLLLRLAELERAGGIVEKPEQGTGG